MKRPVRRVAVWVAVVALCTVYGYRALRGAVAGYAFAQGRLLAAEGPSRNALAYFDVSGVGANRFRANQAAAQMRVRLWKSIEESEGPVAAGYDALDGAAQDYVVALCTAPASPTPWRGLGEVYERRERIRRAALGGDSVATGWSGLGRPGRVAVGMMRRAIERGESWFVLYDELAKLLWRFELEREAEDMAGRSAQVLPMLSRHQYPPGAEMPRPLLDAFAEASWQAIDQVPFVPRRDHLVDLGRIEMLRGRPEAAVRALEAAVDEPGDEVGRVEVLFYLGAALMELGRMDEAESRFDAASAHPAFRDASLLSLAQIAERTGRLELALRHLRDLRWEDPDNLWYCLEYARTARRLAQWDKAVEALRWARINHPEDIRPMSEMAQTHLAQGEVGAAASLLLEIDAMMADEQDEDEQAPQPDPQVEQLRQSLLEAADAPEL